MSIERVIKMHASKHFASKGFTLIESIMTIAITGILAAAIAVFISRPLIGYNQSASRAVLFSAKKKKSRNRRLLHFPKRPVSPIHGAAR